jgi:cytosine/adenosine deaminase-related metal-dependent hydrolase
MAGLTIAHTHLYSALARWMPLPPPVAGDLRATLEKIWWRLDRALDAELIRISARIGIADAVAHGVECVIDHHESPHCIAGVLDMLADEFERAQVRGVICYGATERNGAEREARAALEESDRFLSAPRRPLVRALVGIHAAFTVSDQTLRAAGQLARKHGVGLHTHIAEGECDRDAWSRFVAADAIVPGSLFAHGVYLSNLEIRRVAESGCWLVQNPRSNQGNGVGYARLAPAGDRVALGTDGWDGDLLAETNALGPDADPKQRLAASKRIGELIFGGAFTGTPKHLPVDEAEARAAAERLWARMQELG